MALPVYAKNPGRHWIKAILERNAEQRSADRSVSTSRPERAECFRCSLPHFAGTVIGAPFCFTKNTRSFAGAVLLALRETLCTSSGDS